MGNKDICVSFEKMQKLEELGLDITNASMSYHINGDGSVSDLRFGYCKHSSSNYPAYTLQDMLDVFDAIVQKSKDSLEVEFIIETSKKPTYNWASIDFITALRGDDIHNIYLENESLFNVCYQMLLWCAEHGYCKNI